MACFVVPVAEALITTAITIVLEKSHKTSIQANALEAHSSKLHSSESKHFYKKLKSLSKMLWGGSALLAFEHVWHGEVQPFYPFLTAASDPESLNTMLHEMSTVGISMSILVTLVWAAKTIFESCKAHTPVSEKLHKKG